MAYFTDKRAQELLDREKEAETLRIALRESLVLQSHYAMILNRFDAGERVTFATVEEWIDRLYLVGKIKQGNCPVCGADCAGANPPPMNCPNS